ncbi:hypothetical protein HYW32_00905 [Candidatus Berkelbacteria bacterium]|nr:hypothetical protein [Candidatus Berkelbacteria bacterium]
MEENLQSKKSPHSWLKWILLISVALLAVFVAINTIDGKQSRDNPQTNITDDSSAQDSQNASKYWVQSADGWQSVGTPIACPEPLAFSSITELDEATSVLYPGQMRSVGYEPTAGFRFDRSPNEAISITAPMNGEIVQAARFLVGEETQYVFDVLSPCGILNRFDHLLEIPFKLQAMIDKLPEPKENDSRSTPISPPIKIFQGETIATAVGMRKNNNTFISWTAYDLRQKNKISSNSTWAAEHPGLYHYVICPFPYMPSEDQARIKTLPAADSMSGSKSDFCD